MIEYTVIAKCDGCRTEIARETVNFPSEIDSVKYEWRGQWKEQGFKLDKFRHTVVYCSDCSRVRK